MTNQNFHGIASGEDQDSDWMIFITLLPSNPEGVILFMKALKNYMIMNCSATGRMTLKLVRE
jgi:hypothetical protein